MPKVTTNQERSKIRVVCTECYFEKVVEKAGRKPAKVIIEHGREAGHKLTTKEINSGL